MNIFTQRLPMVDQPAVMGNADSQTLPTVLSSLLLAHDAPRGCRPTEQEVNHISSVSGAAVIAIMQAWADTCKTFAEQQH